MRSSNPKVLIADDQQDVIEALRLLLKGEGFHIDTATSPDQIMSAVEARDFDVALIDLNYARDTTSGQEGLDLLTRIHAVDSTLPVVVMTAWGSVDVAVEAMRRGARDFVQKPWENERLLSILWTQAELSRALRKGLRLEAENQLLRNQGGANLIAMAPAMQPVLQMITRVGPSDANVLITGENGVGKGVIAQALYSISHRANRPLVTVNVGGLPEGVFESELFGHIKGAFTDAKTERVGSSKTRKVNVRIISATNADLHAEVAAGRFRQDLLFRLNTVEIRLPALRDRKEDIPLLANHFLKLHSEHYRKLVTSFDPAAINALSEHPWPGNVRELDHAVERAVLMAQGTIVKASDLGLYQSADSSSRLEDMSLEEVECFLIKKTLARFDGNVSKAAEALGLSRSALYRRLEKFGL